MNKEKNKKEKELKKAGIKLLKQIEILLTSECYVKGGLRIYALKHSQYRKLYHARNELENTIYFSSEE